MKRGGLAVRTQLRAEGAVPECAGHEGQCLQVIDAGVGWREKREDEIHRLAIHGIEGKRLVAAQEDPADLLEIRKTRVRQRDAAPYGIYPCRGEDEWCAIAVEDNDQWRALRNTRVRQRDATADARGPEALALEERLDGAGGVDAVDAARDLAEILEEALLRGERPDRPDRLRPEYLGYVQAFAFRPDVPDQVGSIQPMLPSSLR